MSIQDFFLQKEEVFDIQSGMAVSIKAKVEEIAFESPDCREIERMCQSLARRIRRSKYRFDVIVAIGRGGWVPGRYLADYLGNILALAHMKVEHYIGIAKTQKVRITEPVSAPVRGKRVLLVDDVPDTGDSIALAKKYLRAKGARTVRVACLHYKPWSILKPEYYVRKTRSWVIYPWMRKENLEELRARGEKLAKTGIPRGEIKRLLLL